MLNLKAFPVYIPEDRQEGLAEVMSLSGGRSSAYALMALINGGFGKSNNHYALFQNMGDEDETCYKFLNNINIATGLNIKWLEYSLTTRFIEDFILKDFSYDKFYKCEYTSIYKILDVEKLKSLNYEKSPNSFWYKDGYSDRVLNIKEVDYNSASRNGKPMTDLFLYRCAIRLMKGEGLIMPAAGNRWCTGDGKEKVEHRYLANLGIREFISYKGMRNDEPDRIAKVRKKNDSQDKIWYDCPMEYLKTTKMDVMMAWNGQIIDLGAEKNDNNVFLDVLGNCKYCHLKTLLKKMWLFQNNVKSRLFMQIENICNNYNGDIDAMNRKHGTYEMIEKKAKERSIISDEEILSDEEKQISCFGCGG